MPWLMCTHDELKAILASPAAPRPKTEWTMTQNNFQRRILQLDRTLGCKAKDPPERKGRRGAERPHRALFRRVYENHNFPHQRFVSPVKCSPLGNGAPRTYPRKTDSTVNVGPGGATTKPIPTFKMFERQVNAAGYSWVGMIGLKLHGHRNLPEGWSFDFKNKRLVRKQENNPPVKKQENPPAKEADNAAVASTASGSSSAEPPSVGSSTSTIPSSSSSSSSSNRKRRAYSAEGSSADDMHDPTPKRARRSLPSEQFPAFASIQPLSTTTTPVIPTIGGPSVGAVLDVKIPKTMAKTTPKPKPESKPYRGLLFRTEPQEDDSPTLISKNARNYNSLEPYLKRKAEEVDGAGNFEDNRKSKKQMNNHHMDKAERLSTINSTSEQLTKKSAEHSRSANQKPQNSNTPPTMAHMHNEASVSTTLKDAMRKVQRKVQNSWDMIAPFNQGLLTVAKLWESGKGMKKSGGSPSTEPPYPQRAVCPKRKKAYGLNLETGERIEYSEENEHSEQPVRRLRPSTEQPSSRRAVRPKRKAYVIELGSVKQSEQPVKRPRLRRAEESMETDSRDQNFSQQLTRPRCNVARPKARRVSENLLKTAIHNSMKSTGPASSAPSTPFTHEPVRGTNSFELIGPRPVFECGVNGAHFLPLRFRRNDKDGSRVTELPWPGYRGITTENLDWNSAEQIGWLNKWASRVLQQFGC